MDDWTAEDLGRRALELELMDERQLNAVWADFGTRDVPLDDFSAALVRREFLTNFQLERLLRGESHGFFYGDYKVLYLVGSGTFARVYRGVHRQTGRVVAVKVLRRRYTDDPVKSDLFMREGEMGTLLRHPAIVPIYEVRKERRLLFMVMEFVEGRDLRRFVKVRGKLAPEEALRIMLDIAGGLSYAFEKGVCHRDMKMSNVLVATAGRAKLVDFGLAAIAGGMSESEMADLENPRTIDYAGLERATGVRKDDKRSDIFFAGCIFYNMLTGVPALAETRERSQRLAVSRYQNIKPILELEPDLPRPLVQICNRAMEFRPDKRYSTPNELYTDLKLLQRKLDAGGWDEEPTAESSASPKKALSRSEEGVDRTVMVVESNVKIQDMLREPLKKCGYRVLVISNPDRAISRFDDDPKAADCVIFSTIELGFAGLDAFNQFQADEKTRAIPAMLLVAEKQKKFAQQAKLDPLHVAVAMPLSMKKLRAWLLKTLASKV
ncbi:MAG: protein kinase [Planctomycetes bacterium]|nr:protein kinase [Planctomycetota bacterium]